MLSLKDKNLIMLMVEGFGFSASWHGNAIMAGDAKYYQNYWNHYPHFILNHVDLEKSSTFSSEELKKMIYTKIASSKNIDSDRDFISKSTSSDSFYHNQALTRICDWSKSQNSSIHLIGNLSSKLGRYGSVEELLSIIKFAKLHQCYRVYLHLVLDSSQTKDINDAAYLARYLENKLHEFGVGEIASISGRKYLFNNVASFQIFNKSLQAIIFGRGKKSLSSEQAFHECDRKISSPDDFIPIFIESSGNAIGTINDFDAIIFFNHNNEDLSSFLNYLSNNNSSSILKTPSFLKIATFLPADSENMENTNTIFNRNIPKGLTSVLSENNLKQAYIFDRTRSNYIEEYFQGHAMVEKNFLDNYLVETPLNTDQYQHNYKEIIHKFVAQTNDCLKKQPYNFIMITMPLLAFVGSKTGFDATKSMVGQIDIMIHDLIRISNQNNANFIFTSPFGGVEKLTGRDNFEKSHNITSNPVPFFIYLNDIEKMSYKSNLFFNGDIMKSKKVISDITPTIIDYFDLEIPDYIKGESMIKLLKEEVDYES